MSSIIKPSKIEQQTILSYLGKLPSEELLREHLTPLQSAHWLDVREEMLLLRQDLTAFFNGDASVLPFLGEEGEHLQYLKDYLLELYELIRTTWSGSALQGTTPATMPHSRVHLAAVS